MLESKLLRDILEDKACHFKIFFKTNLMILQVVTLMELKRQRGDLLTLGINLILRLYLAQKRKIKHETKCVVTVKIKEELP